MELKINELAIPDKITFNYDELKAELTDKVKTYEAIVYGDEQIKEAKADKANLNKLKKALNDERIRLEREYMTPFNAFKAQITDLIETIDKPIAGIDSQVKAYDEKVKADKRANIEEYFNNIPADDKPDFLTLDQIWDDKWLNASVSMKSITVAIEDWILKAENDLETLKSLTEFSFEAIEEYKRTLDVNRAIAEGKRLADIQRRKAEAEAQVVKPQDDKPAEPTPEPVQATDEVKEAAGMWVSFRAYLNNEQAAALKAFFVSNNINFEAV